MTNVVHGEHSFAEEELRVRGVERGGVGWGGCRSEEHCFVGDIGSTIREIVSGRLVRLLERRTRPIAETLITPRNPTLFSIPDTLCSMYQSRGPPYPVHPT